MFTSFSQVSNYNTAVFQNGLGKFTKSHSASTKSGRNQRPHEFILQDLSAKLLPRERVCNCCKKRIDKNTSRNVMYNMERKQTYWGNVQRCGSLWTCPVCSKQISEKRKSELKQAVEFWKGQGGGLLLLTLTSPHTSSDALSFVLEAQKQALKSFFSDRKGQNLFKLLGKKHQIRSFEVTYGKNGWHPHYHILLFVERKIDFSSDADSEQLEFASNLYDLFLKHWQNCCLKNGLKMPNKHGLDIKDGSYAEEYISKFGDNETKIIWGIESEMTKGIVKRGRFTSLHPFDLLTLSEKNEQIFGDKLPSKLFQEYAISTKGKRQLVWSRGLKKLCGIIEQSDEEIVNDTEQKSIKIVDVDAVVFDVLSTTQTRHLFLNWVKDDYEDGTLFENSPNFGDGITNINLIQVFERYIEMQSDDYISQDDKNDYYYDVVDAVMS